MKKIFFTLGIAAVASISLFSCSKGEYNSGDGQTGYNRYASVNNKPKVVTNGTFTAKMNGVDFIGDADKCWIYEDSATKLWVIGGFKGSGLFPQGFGFTVNKHEKGIYTIDKSNSNAPGVGFYQAEGTTASIVIGETGKVEITDISEKKESGKVLKTVKGKFEMKAPGFDVTEGNFSVPLIE